MGNRGLRSATASVLAVICLMSIPPSSQGQTTTRQTWSPLRTPDGQPDLQGYWTNQGSVSTVNIEGTISTQDSPIIHPADKKVPYQPWARARRDEHTANHLNPKTIDDLDAESRCLPIGVPRINYATPYNGYQFLQKPGYVVLVAEWNHISRIIPLDGRPHVGSDIRLWMGDSRGRWEGNTLIVDVTNFTDKTWLDEVGNFHSDALHVIERYRIADANTIAYEATLEDPKVFTQPLTMGFDFKRATVGDGTKLLVAGKLEDANLPKNANPGFFQDAQSPNYQLYEYACHEGNLAIENIFGREVFDRLMGRRPLAR